MIVIMLIYWLRENKILIWEYLKKSNKNLSKAPKIIVYSIMYSILYLLYILLIIINNIKKTIVSNNWIGNSLSFKTWG